MTSNRKVKPASKGVLTEGIIGLDGEPYVSKTERPNTDFMGLECAVYETQGCQSEPEKKPGIDKESKKLDDDGSLLPNPIYDQDILITRQGQAVKKQAPFFDDGVYEYAEDYDPEQAQEQNLSENRSPDSINSSRRGHSNYISMRSPKNRSRPSEKYYVSIDFQPIQHDGTKTNAFTYNCDYNDDDEHIYETLSLYQDFEEDGKSSRLCQNSQCNDKDPFTSNSSPDLEIYSDSSQTAQLRCFYVINEIVDTENAYLENLEVIINDFKKPLMEKETLKSFKLGALFSNMEEVRGFSSSFLACLQAVVKDTTNHQPNIGRVFLENFDRMRSVYMIYCRNYDDAIELLNKLKNEQPVRIALEECIQNVRTKVKVNDLASLLIKPVQRVLKYPLLLRELEKNTENLELEMDDSYRKDLKKATAISRDVAKDINEGKRGIDIVKKYRTRSETTKLSGDIFHTIKKKADRLSMKLARATGRCKVFDEEFDNIEERFMLIEKVLSEFASNCENYLVTFGEAVTEVRHLSEDIPIFYGSDCCKNGVILYKTTMIKIKDYLFARFCKQVQDQVTSPLKLAHKRMTGPQLLINKRFDKLLDYEKCLDEEDEKTQVAKSNYEALNQQLLDELPKLCNSACQLLESCLKLFVKLQIDFHKEMLNNASPVLKVFTNEETANQQLTRKQIMERFDQWFSHTRMAMNSFTIIPDLIEEKYASSVIPESSNQYSPIYMRRQNAQTRIIKEKLFSSFKEEDLYLMTKDFSSTDETDISANKHDLIGVKKRKHPLGNQTKWFCDNGVAEGFIPFDLLKPYKTDLSYSKWKSPTYETIPFLPIYSRETLNKPNQLRRTPNSSLNHSPYSLRQKLSKDLVSEPEEDYYVINDGYTQNDVYDIEDEMLDDTEYGIILDYQNQNKKALYVVLHDFSSSSSLELSVKRNEVVTLIMPHDIEGVGDWWLVAKSDGKQGYVPSNFLNGI